VSSAIIGPRTLEQLESQLGVEKVVLPADVLDRIDEIVPPGTTQRGGPGLRTSGPRGGCAAASVTVLAGPACVGEPEPVVLARLYHGARVRGALHATT
jgi:hypothetical protein